MDLELKRSLISMRINELIHGLGLQQKDVAYAIGMSPQLFSTKMHDKSAFSVKDLAALADYFNVSVDYLLGRDATGSHLHSPTDEYEEALR